MKSTLAIALLLVACQVQAEREKRVLSFFNVVKFPNALCQGSGSRNGTCYTAEECEDRSGTAAGSCADGFGVCCVITLDCDGSSSENNTYFVKESFTTATKSSCPFTICPASTSVCRVKLEFKTFTLAGTNQVAGTATTVGPSIGDCTSDSFAAPGAPIICGSNSGEHIFLDSDGTTCLTNVFTFDGDSTTRALDIMIKQYDCKGQLGGPPGCLQYFTGATGTVKSFNFATSTNRHLSSQDYDICFRRESGSCSICYKATTTAFGLSISPEADKAQSAVDATCSSDYLEIPNGMTAAIAKLTALGTGVTRFCGRLLNLEGAKDATTDVCTATRPFKISVKTDAGEVVTNAAVSDQAKANELSTPAPLGTLGFELTFTQQTC